MGSVRVVGIVLLALGLLALGAPPEWVPVEAVRHWLVEQRIRVFGRSAEDHFRLAERYNQARDYEKAEVACRNSLRLNPAHARARELLETVQIVKALQVSSLDLHRRGKCNLMEMFESLARVEMNNFLSAADRFATEGEVDKAEMEYRKVLEYAKWMPTSVEIDEKIERAHLGLACLMTSADK